MKHIRQSSQKHTSGSLYIAEDIPGFAPAADLGAVLSLPISDCIEKPVPVCRGTNAGNLEKDFSQLSGIKRLGESPAPRQPLPLNMDQASLHRDIRPELAENPYHIRVTIHGKAMRAQAVLDKTIKEHHKLELGVFRDRVLSSHNLAILRIHQSNEAVWAVQESAVQYQMLALSQSQQGRSSLFQIVVNHTIKLCRTMFALARQLSD